MKWKEVKEAYPDQWLVVEALEAHTTSDSIRHIEEVSIIEKCTDGEKAMTEYRRLHKSNPLKEYYFIHTSRDDLDIPERKWIGIRN
ncbi:MAG: hypothetical protein GY754_31770 [bacterium]|nr:hypothetical protein [bacterium]